MMLPKFSDEIVEQPCAEFVMFADQRLGNLPAIRRTLDELVSEKRREDLGAYELSIPTGIWPGKRWLTRDPEIWQSFWPQQDVHLCEVTPFSVPGRDGGLRVYKWRIEIAGEAEARAVWVLAATLKKLFEIWAPIARRALARGGNAADRRRARRRMARS